MKRLGALALAALLGVPGLPLSAQPLRVVTESATYTYLKDGKVAGSATEVVEATLRLAGFGPYEIELVPWARAYDTALHNPKVLIYLIARTPEREAQVQWIREVTRIRYQLYKLKSRKDIVLGGLDDARRYSIAVVRDDVRYQYLRGHGFSRLVVSAQASEGLRQLFQGRADLLPMSEAALSNLCREVGVDCADLEPVQAMEDLSPRLYMAFSHGTPAEWGERLGRAYDQLKAEGVVQKLMDKGP